MTLRSVRNLVRRRLPVGPFCISILSSLCCCDCKRDSDIIHANAFSLRWCVGGAFHHQSSACITKRTVNPTNENPGGTGTCHPSAVDGADNSLMAPVTRASTRLITGARCGAASQTPFAVALCLVLFPASCGCLPAPFILWAGLPRGLLATINFLSRPFF